MNDIFKFENYNIHWRQVWWYIPEFRKPRQEDYRIEANIGYIVISCLKNNEIKSNLKRKIVIK